MGIFLEDDSIRLRAVEPDDGYFMWAVETDSTQWIENGMSAPFSRHNLEEYARGYDADPIRCGQLRLIIEKKERENFESVGIIDLYDISPIGRTAFVGIYVCPDRRGRSLGKRALILIERYSSQLLNLRMLGAKISDNNIASRRLFESAGYNQTGMLPSWILSGEKSSDLLIFAKKIN